ncbi:ThiF family adenylyltransferase [Sphingomonas cannabina]|uniref:ThiF family adenylyltransferase n=1 Tax=Sphingomonas cannabina TaxID=2899123 RepID=UPI001F387428|nr:ThiF family adenylyltransferase [Sphingomonas cannabina]UIJ46243.1 ThiF family adenylyltransferase [Sphingomonas cannabina]
MFRKLVSHNPDLGRLVERGYAVAFDSNCLIVRDIPYLDREGDLQWGAIVAKLVFVDHERVQQDDHQVYFAGTHPHQLDGTPIRNLGGGATTIQLTAACADVVVQRSFSNKPKATGKFEDFFEKIESYVSVIAGPAMAKFDANPYTFRCREEIAPDTIFKFQDTLTSRAQIGDLNEGFAEEVVAVIGLGGTGAYLLDLLVKTPVPEIRGFDGDGFHVHNAFRSPGRLDGTELGLKKVEVYEGRYENFRHGLRLEATYIDEGSADAFAGVTFAFVCVDKGSARAAIFELLVSLGIPFIDVGMGLKRKDGPLNGMLRVTYYSAEDAAQMCERQLAELSDVPDNLYRANIQIGELNALNACLALIRYKQLRGFYREEEALKHLLFGVGDLRITGESSFDDV